MLLIGVVLAGPADAHATLLFTDPGIDGAVPSSPAAVTLVFDEPVTVPGDPVRLSDASGREFSFGAARWTNAGRVLTVPVRAELGSGVFTVRWQAVSDDGDTIGGSYRFAVGPATSAGLTGAGGDRSNTPGLPATAVLRWVLFTALAVALGGLVGERLVRPHAPSGLAVPAPPLGVAATAGLVASTGLALRVAGNGSLWRGATNSSLSALTVGRPGRLALVEVLAFAAAGCLVAARKPTWAAVPLLGVVFAEGLRAHAATAAPGWGALLTGVHLLAASVWFGALVQIVRTGVAWRGRRRQAWAVVGAYARVAAWLFATVVVTGTITALVLVPWSTWTSTDYGRTLLVKLALVAVVSFFALLARRRMRRENRTDHPGESPGRAAGAERVALGLVLAVTALLVSLPPPRALGVADLPLPPPPVGLAVPMGARAGQVGVSATASAGQLVVRLSAPQRGLRTADEADGNRYRLTGSVATGARPPRKLTWRGCGPGCFVAPVTWAGGVNQVSLRARAERWAGGAVTLPLPWPARPGQQALRRVVEAMSKVRSFVLYERVTSDSRRGPGNVMRLPLNGADFLASEPYGSGIASQAAVVRRAPDGGVTLRVGFPAERAQAELVIDADGRIVRETLTAPFHWITRTFVYPGAGDQ